MGIVKIVVYMIPLIAILENGFDSFVCGSVIIYQVIKYSHHLSFSWIETSNHATCVMNENFHLWEIKTNSLFTCICESSEGLGDRVHLVVH